MVNVSFSRGPRHWRTGRQGRPRFPPFAGEEVCMRDFRDAKAMAHALRHALKDRAFEATHSESLELIAKAFGYDNWNILAAKIEAAELQAAVLSSADSPESPPPVVLFCSFCGKSQHDVKKLIAGPGVYICDGCVGLCTEIVDGEEPLWKVFSLLAEAEK